MATKSILKKVTVKSKGMGRSLAEALEKSVDTMKKPVEYKRKCTEVKKGSVKKFFDNY